MGFHTGNDIRDVGTDTTNPSGDNDIWKATLDLRLSEANEITGDFNVFHQGHDTGDAGNITYEFSGIGFSAYGADGPEANNNMIAVDNWPFGTLTTNSTDGTYTFVADWDAVLASGYDQLAYFHVTPIRNGVRGETDGVYIQLLICVARGTRIATPDGEVPVESLAVGDLVDTVDGPAQAVRWIGSRMVGKAELAARPHLRPVRIRAGALGENRPVRDLLVSPQHRVLLGGWRAELLFGEDEVLAPAKALVNDDTIRIDTAAEEVEYFHILFDTHQIMLTEGLPTESFHPQEYSLNALDRAVRDEILSLFPALADMRGQGKTARLSLRPWEARMLLDGAAEA